MRGYDAIESVASLQRTWGIEGQPFAWSIGSCRSAPGGLHADVELSEASTVALLDAAVHVARLVDSSNPQLMFPVRVSTASGSKPNSPTTTVRVEVRRRGGNDDELIVDIAVKAPDGSTCIDIRGLRYAAVDSGPVRGRTRRSTRARWRTRSSGNRWAEHDDAHWPPDAVEHARGVGRGRTPPALCAIGSADAGYMPAAVAEARCVLYVADPGPVTPLRPTSTARSVCRRRWPISSAGWPSGMTSHPATLWIITRGVREAVSDAAVRQSCLWGTRRGHPGRAAAAVGRPGRRCPRRRDIGDCAPALSTVLRTPAKSILALRDGEFLAPALAPVSGEPVREPLRCRPDAAYLITGGMGALGLLMAGWLADRGARRLILAGRTPLPPRRDWDSDTNDADVRHKIAAIRALEMRGVSVDAVALDIGSRDAVQALLARRDDDGEPCRYAVSSTPPESPKANC